MEKINFKAKKTNLGMIKKHILDYKISVVRNFDSIPFPYHFSAEQKNMVDNEMISFIEKKKKGLRVARYEDLDDSEALKLSRKRLIDLAQVDEKSRFLYDESTLLLFNEINHLTINIIGSSFPTIYKQVLDIEKKFEDFAPFLVNTRYGYISPHILSSGLGVKLSVLVHLTGVKKSGHYESIKSLSFERGYNVEIASDFPENADLYCISSRFNYGLSEEELIEGFIKGVIDILNMENQLLADYYYDNKDIDDEIYRSVGLLSYARKMSNDEMLLHFSVLRVALKLNKKLVFNLKQLNDFQNKVANTVFSLDTHLFERASMIRQFMEGNND